MGNVKTRILLRSDIASRWSSVNPILLRGEVGIEYNPAVEPSEGRRIKFKIGDGVTEWNRLEYVADYDSVVSAIETRIGAVESKVGESSVADQISAAISALASVYQEKLPEGASAGKYLTADEGDNLVWRAVADPTWANITGNISDNKALSDALAAKQNVINSEHKLSVDLIDVQEGSDRQFVTENEKSQIAKIAGLETTVGDANSGLVKGVADNKKAIADEAAARAEADTALSNAIGQKVDKVDGKDLIETSKIQKLDKIEEGAQANVIEKISVNGVDVSVDENKKAVISGLATSSDLGLLQSRVTEIERKEAGWEDKYTKQETDNLLNAKANSADVYTKGEADSKIAEEIGKIKHWTTKIVEQLPEPSAECSNAVYLVPKSGKQGYKEYICVNEGTEEASSWRFEEIGDTDVDLSDYYRKSETYSATAIDGKLALKQDKLTAGTNVEITKDNVVNVKEDETTVKLSEDLYTYTNIGKITGASQTNPIKVASLGDSLKSVFNAILGTEVDVNPTITDRSAVTPSQSGNTNVSGAEVGTSISAQDGTVTFTVVNSGVAQYGVKTESAHTYNKKGANTNFVYPIKTNVIRVGEEDKSYNIRVELNSAYHGLVTATAGTIVATSENYIYCNLGAENKLVLKIAMGAETSTVSQIIRCGQLKAYVEFEDAQYNGEPIEHFCTYLDAAYTQKLSRSAIISSATAAYTVSAGTYYPYFGQTTSTVAPTSGLTKSEDKVCYTDGTIVKMAADGYIWFMVPVAKSSKKIQQYALGSWNDMATTDAGAVTLTLASGATASYKAFRTTAEQGSGSSLQVRIVE